MLQYKSEAVEYLSRPKVLALSEFGPQNIIYNNGSKFRVARMMLTGELNSDKFSIILKRVSYIRTKTSVRIIQTSLLVNRLTA